MLDMETIAKNKERFLTILSENVERNGIEKLMAWLLKTDFFEAPASTRYHAAYAGGLCAHSLNVYDVYMKKHYEEGVDNMETVSMITLLHDLCKANFYQLSKRNQKIDGKWVEVDYYTIDDAFPYGHGEKSVFLVERFVRLKTDEACAIRWHMGGFDDHVKAGGFSVSASFEKFPISVKLHLSDLEASYLVETSA